MFGKKVLNMKTVKPLQKREKNRWVGEWWYLPCKGQILVSFDNI